MRALTLRGLPGPPQLFNRDVLVFSVQVAVFVGLLLLHVFNDKLQLQQRLFRNILKGLILCNIYFTNVF